MPEKKVFRVLIQTPGEASKKLFERMEKIADEFERVVAQRKLDTQKMSLHDMAKIIGEIEDKISKPTR